MMKIQKIRFSALIIAFVFISNVSNAGPTEQCQEQKMNAIRKNNPEIKSYADLQKAAEPKNNVEGVLKKQLDDYNSCASKTTDQCEKAAADFSTKYSALTKSCQEAAAGAPKDCIEKSMRICVDQMDEFAERKDDKISSLAGLADSKIGQILREFEKDESDEKKKMGKDCPMKSYKDWEEKSDKLTKALDDAKKELTTEQNEYGEESQRTKKQISDKTNEISEAQKEFERTKRDMSSQQRDNYNKAKEDMQKMQKAIENKQAEISKAQSDLDFIPLKRAQIIQATNNICKNQLNEAVAKYKAEKAKNPAFTPYKSSLAGAAGSGNTLTSNFKNMFNQCLEATQIQKAGELKNLVNQEKSLKSTIDSGNQEIQQMYSNLQDVNNQANQILQESQQQSQSEQTSYTQKIQSIYNEIKSLNEMKQNQEMVHNQKMMDINDKIKRIQTELDDMPEPPPSAKADIQSTAGPISEAYDAAKKLKNLVCCSDDKNPKLNIEGAEYNECGQARTVTDTYDKIDDKPSAGVIQKDKKSSSGKVLKDTE